MGAVDNKSRVGKRLGIESLVRATMLILLTLSVSF